MRGFVMNVVGIEQRDQHVHIEQRDAAHGSSRSRFTKSNVRLTAPGRRARSGTPLRTDAFDCGSNACRAHSDSNLPTVVSRFAAISWPPAGRRRRYPRWYACINHHTSRITHQATPFVSESRGHDRCSPARVLGIECKIVGRMCTGRMAWPPWGTIRGSHATIRRRMAPPRSIPDIRELRAASSRRSGS